MKNMLVMGGVGVGLFVATVVGLLGAQGRLNYEGSRGVPLLSMLFSAPLAEAGEHGEHGEAAGDDHAHGADSHAGAAHGEPAEFGVRHEGLGKEPPLKYQIGKSALQPEEPAGGGHGGGHSAPDPHGGATDAHGAPAHGDAADHAHNKPSPKLTPPRDDFQQQMEGLLGQGQYRRGNFFKFPRLEGDITVEQLNGYLRAAKLGLDELENERARLQSHEKDLDARQRDIEDRERMVAEQMAKVDGARLRLDERVREFHREVALVRSDELSGLKQYAATLASFEPQRAMEHVVQSWETEDGRTRILKVLAVMDPEVLNLILAELEMPRLKEILVDRLKVVIEEGKR